jgi:NADH-quinone oxidoreductase subunit J
LYVLMGADGLTTGTEVLPKEVSVALLGPYLLGVELASILLLAGLVGAFHLGRRGHSRESEIKE